MYYSRSQASALEESVDPCLSDIVWLRIREELLLIYLPSRTTGLEKAKHVSSQTINICTWTLHSACAENSIRNVDPADPASSPRIAFASPAISDIWEFS
jgi:hypothetical protein